MTATIPLPLPSNAQAWKAFRLVRRCRDGFTGGFNWLAVMQKLEMHGLNHPLIHHKLELIEDAVAVVEAEDRDAKEEETA